MNDLFSKEAFDHIYKSSNSRRLAKAQTTFGNVFDGMNEIGMESYSQKSESSLNEQLAVGPQEEYYFQHLIRKQFGKSGLNTRAIADHPDFANLAITNELKNQYICTIFIDLKGSTRLSLLYPLDLIYDFKNAVLMTCIDVVRSFDGHVHRLMGDAIMAFFGDSKMEKEQAIADALNCVLMLRLILENSIRPWLKSQFPNFDIDHFGFRIGCNFGDDDEVLWGNYGYGKLGEVSPTGFPVDLAAKLQGLASKNHTMLGQGLIDFINWPEEYSEIKIVERDGTKVQQKFVTPSYTDKDGNIVNYKMRILNFKEAIKYLPLGPSNKKIITSNYIVPCPSISFKCFIDVDGNKVEYISASRYLERNLSIFFEVSAITRSDINFPLAVTFTKKNNGENIPKHLSAPIPTVQYIVRQRSGFGGLVNISETTILKEGTTYRGLHTMTCEVRDNKGVMIFRDVIAVMIK